MAITIDEAIRILNLDIESGCSTPPANLDEAEGLGIEALKRVDDQRNGKVVPFEKWLPGETEDIVRGMTETMFINPETD